MDDIVEQKQVQENLDEDSGSPIEDVKPRVMPQMSVMDAVEILDSFKNRMVGENYDQMLEDGDAEVRVPMEVVDALEVMVYFVNTSFEMDEEI